jgi:hypothetical protein
MMKHAYLIGLGLILPACALLAQQPSDSAMSPRMQAISDNSEYLHALQMMDQTVLENAKILIHNLETRQARFDEMDMMHAREIERGLLSSQQYLDRLEKATDIVFDKIELTLLSGLHRHYLKAMEQQKLIQDELAKATPENSVISMKAAIIYAEMKKAGEEQKQMLQKMGIKEPGEPVLQESKTRH